MKQHIIRIITCETRKHFYLNENGNTYYQNFCDEDKQRLEENLHL